MFLAIIMFNMLINKTKKIFEDTNSSSTNLTPAIAKLLVGDPIYEENKQELKETIYGKYCTK